MPQQLGNPNEAANRRFEFDKRSQLFIGTHNESPTVIAMRVCNPVVRASAILSETLTERVHETKRQ